MIKRLSNNGLFPKGNFQEFKHFMVKTVYHTLRTDYPDLKMEEIRCFANGVSSLNENDDASHKEVYEPTLLFPKPSSRNTKRKIKEYLQLQLELSGPELYNCYQSGTKSEFSDFQNQTCFITRLEERVPNKLSSSDLNLN
jgi:hypothetical protein